jgi:hypothetical protein
VVTPTDPVTTTGVGEHPDTPDHPDGYDADCGTSAEDGAPPHTTASLLGGGESTGTCSVDRLRAAGDSTS